MASGTQLWMNRLIAEFPPQGPRLLELGAATVSMKGFQEALPSCRYTGIDLDPTDEAIAAGILRGDANDLRQFPDESFDAVVSISMYEHNPRFWESLTEVRRVLAPGGRFYVSAPGYRDKASLTARVARRIRNRLWHAGWDRPAEVASWLVATRTYPFHLEPDDYFRFSPQAVRHVLLDGLRVLAVRSVRSPPHVQGVGQKK